MSLYVLDTDVLTLYRHGHPLVSQRVNARPDADLAITVLTVEEQLAGWYTRVRKARLPKQQADAYQDLAESLRLLGRWQVLPFPEPAIMRFKQLKVLRLNIGGVDLGIAVIALEFGGILVARNLRDFQRVPNLTLENWAA